MSHRTIIAFCVLLIACQVTVASIFDLLNLSCKCARLTRSFIRPSKYARVEIFPSGVACKKMEIIITLKNSNKVCVDPSARWVTHMMVMMENVNKIAPAS